MAIYALGVQQNEIHVLTCSHEIWYHHTLELFYLSVMDDEQTDLPMRKHANLFDCLVVCI